MFFGIVKTFYLDEKNCCFSANDVVSFLPLGPQLGCSLQAQGAFKSYRKIDTPRSGLERGFFFCVLLDMKLKNKAFQTIQID
jgi:hypothetical protein